LPDTRVIEPARGWQAPNLRELWDYRDLAFFLVKRDVSIRYRQTLIGTVWAILQPLLLAVVFSVFLGHYAKVPSGANVPYPVFALTGMAMWLYFSQAMQFASDSTVNSRELIGKVWFPRMIIPLAAVLPPAIDFVPAFIVALIVQLALGAGLWLSALNVRYRDVRLVVPFLIMIGLFVTPIVYPFDTVPDSVQPIYALNPLVGVLEAYRWMLFPDAQWPGALLLIPLATAAILLVSGAWYFTRAERDFADVI
jgi:lipopolysaccharide transport system permease protein